MDEIEKLTKITNDFICDSHGVIVTEYCKKKETWDNYRSVPYQLSKEFLDSLIPLSLEKEHAESSKSSQKESNNIKSAMELYSLGADYWRNLLNEAMKKNMLSFKEISLLKVIIDVDKTGNLPSPSQAKAIKKIQEKINDEGIF